MTKTDRTGSHHGLASLKSAHTLKTFKRNDRIFFEKANAPATGRVTEANCRMRLTEKSI